MLADTLLSATSHCDVAVHLTFVEGIGIQVQLLLARAKKVSQPKDDPISTCTQAFDHAVEHSVHVSSSSF